MIHAAACLGEIKELYDAFRARRRQSVGKCARGVSRKEKAKRNIFLDCYFRARSRGSLIVLIVLRRNKNDGRREKICVYLFEAAFKPAIFG